MKMELNYTIRIIILMNILMFFINFFMSQKNIYKVFFNKQRFSEEYIFIISVSIFSYLVVFCALGSVFENNNGKEIYSILQLKFLFLIRFITRYYNLLEIFFFNIKQTLVASNCLEILDLYLLKCILYVSIYYYFLFFFF